MKLWLILALAFAACNEPRGVVLWHAYSDQERTALEANAAAWNSTHPDTPLTLVFVPHDAFADKLSSAIPRGNGPDLFIYPQDRIGDWADAGVIEPLEFWVDDARADRFAEDALGAMTYRDSLWGLPFAQKTLALYYRTDLVAQPPNTTDELLALAPAMRARHGFALAYANVDLYGHSPWLHGFGGRVMDDAGKLAIATPEAAAAMTFARELVTTGAVPDDAQDPLVASLFNEGRAATAMAGPYFAANIADGVPWKVAPLPIISATGKPAAPFASTEGVLMSARAANKATAFAVMDFLTQDRQAKVRALRGHQIVPNAVLGTDPELVEDKVISAFTRQLAHVVPMPKGSGMRVVWTPYRTALGDVLSGRAEPYQRLVKLEGEIAGYAERK